MYPHVVVDEHPSSHELYTNKRELATYKGVMGDGGRSQHAALGIAGMQVACGTWHSRIRLCGCAGTRSTRHAAMRVVQVHVARNTRHPGIPNIGWILDAKKNAPRKSMAA